MTLQSGTHKTRTAQPRACCEPTEIAENLNERHETAELIAQRDQDRPCKYDNAAVEIH